jgi:hypothetical protein
MSCVSAMAAGIRGISAIGNNTGFSALNNVRVSSYALTNLTKRIVVAVGECNIDLRLWMRRIPPARQPRAPACKDQEHPVDSKRTTGRDSSQLFVQHNTSGQPAVLLGTPPTFNFGDWQSMLTTV